MKKGFLEQGYDFRAQVDILSTGAVFGEVKIPGYSPDDPRLFWQNGGHSILNTLSDRFCCQKFHADRIRIESYNNGEMQAN